MGWSRPAHRDEEEENIAYSGQCGVSLLNRSQHLPQVDLQVTSGRGNVLTHSQSSKFRLGQLCELVPVALVTIAPLFDVEAHEAVAARLHVRQVESAGSDLSGQPVSLALAKQVADFHD